MQFIKKIKIYLQKLWQSTKVRRWRRNVGWFRYKFRYHIRTSIVAIYLGALGVISLLSLSAYAINTWSQTDWSGGQSSSVASSNVTTFLSQSGIDSSTAGQIKMQQTSGWAASLTSWSQRKQVNITNSGSAQTDYQVRLSVTYDSAMQSDFDDLRFTNSSGTLLNYWIEAKTDGVSATIWVKVDSLNGSGATQIYMYYSNPAASAGSDGDSTFIFFDGFDGTSLDSTKWSELGGTGNFNVGSGNLLAGPGTSAWNRGMESKTTFTRANLALEFRLKWTSNNTSYDAFMFGWHNTTSDPNYTAMTYAYYNQGDGSSTTVNQMVYEDGAGRLNSSTYRWLQGVQYDIRLRLKASSGNDYSYSTDGGNSWTTAYDTAYSSAGSLKIGFAQHSGTFELDNVRIRQWSSTEPSATFGSSESEYPATSVLTSNIFDASFPSDWGLLTYNSTGAGSVEVRVRTSTAPDMSSAPDWSSCSAISSNTTLSANTCVNNTDRYVQYQITMVSSGGNAPIFQDISINYTSSDLIAPTTNASTIVMKTSSTGRQVAGGGWDNAATPYFSWTAGADNAGGSGIKGYCLYLGSDNTADPRTTKGLLGASPVDTAGACQFAVSTNNVDLSLSGLLGGSMIDTTSSYYLNVKAIDIANNVFTGPSAQFSFKFDGTDPNPPAFITAPSQFISTKDVTFTWDTSGVSAPSDATSGLAGLQYRIGASGTWYGDTHNGSQSFSDLLTNDGSYQTVDPIDYNQLQEGNNIVYFRAVDNAQNYSDVLTTTVVKINTSSPTQPRSVTASPLTNTLNSFGFSWIKPATFTGSESNLTYCYTVNTLPSASTCIFTDPGQTSLAPDAYATQPGVNTFYVVAKDEAGNINYATYGYTNFTANTSAPGIPQNLSIADISIKATSNWKLALTWDAPSNVGAGVAKYEIYRALSLAGTYTKVASTSGNSYVDGGLSQQTYYYQIKACDSANNCSAYSSTVSALPTGRFTSPATLTSGPDVSDIGTRKATITWATDRTSNSAVAFGTASGQYGASEISSSAQTIFHTIELVNLNPGTTYYFLAKWTDDDGNTGIAQELSFTTEPAPTISDASVIGVNLTQSTIQFTSTGAYQVKFYYGKSEGFGGLKLTNTSASKSTYTVQLTGLDDGTKYFFKLNPIDAGGHEYQGTVLSFTTPPMPHITNLRFQPVSGKPTSTQEVTWTTNVPTTTGLVYGVIGENQLEIYDSKVATEHSVTINNLKDDSEYFLYAQSRDSSGNLTTSDRQVFHTALDTRPPTISNITVQPSIQGTGAEARGQVVVSWRTDEPATSQVAYAEGTGVIEFTSKTSEDTGLSFEHVVIVSDLPTSRVYSIQPISFDKARNSTSGSVQSAIVGHASEDILSIVLNSLKGIFGF